MYAIRLLSPSLFAETKNHDSITTTLYGHVIEEFFNYLGISLSGNFLTRAEVTNYKYK